MELLKQINLIELIVQVISFLILLTLLRVFAWKRILNTLDERRKRIAAEFKGIEDAKTQAAELKSSYEARLAAIEQEAAKRLSMAVEEARKAVEEMRKDAHARAQDIITDARKSIAYELKKAQDEVKDKIVDLAIGAAEVVIREKLSEKGDRRIVEEFIENMDNTE